METSLIAIRFLEIIVINTELLTISSANLKTNNSVEQKNNIPEYLLKIVLVIVNLNYNNYYTFYSCHQSNVKINKKTINLLNEISKIKSRNYTLRFELRDKKYIPLF